MADEEFSCDVPECLTLLSQISDRAQEFKKHMSNVTQFLENDLKYNKNKGLDFLGVKSNVLAGYLTDLSSIILRKTCGKSIQDDTALHRLVENRTVLERMKPINDRLKYQIAKLVKASLTGKTGVNDPLRLKPQPSQLVSKVAEVEADASDEDEKKSKLYVPPKLAPAHYEGDMSLDERRLKKVTQAKKRALNTGLMRELQAEYSDGPREIIDDRRRSTTQNAAFHKTQFEEDRFVRFNETRKEKHARRRPQQSLNTITHFRDVSSLDADFERFTEKKHKSTTNKKSGKGNKKRKYRH